MSKGFSFKDNAATEPDVDTVLHFLSYEVGSVQDCYIKFEYSLDKLFKTWEQHELADVICVARLFCELVEIQYEDNDINWEFVNRLVGSDRLLLGMSICVGKLAQIFHYTNIFRNADTIGTYDQWIGNLDTLIQNMCSIEGWNYDELVDYGEKKYLDKMEEIRKFNADNQPHIVDIFKDRLREITKDITDPRD